ncbi:hypothetical protein MPSEU_000943900 [Mayamaea pseudoterrestris]|nr:hypothetical protein MPSEU_000943900 [Mayamaea pseudoterrestris]
MDLESLRKMISRRDFLFERLVLGAVPLSFFTLQAQDFKHECQIHEDCVSSDVELQFSAPSVYFRLQQLTASSDSVESRVKQIHRAHVKLKRRVEQSFRNLLVVAASIAASAR